MKEELHHKNSMPSPYQHFDLELECFSNIIVPLSCLLFFESRTTQPGCFSQPKIQTLQTFYSVKAYAMVQRKITVQDSLKSACDSYGITKLEQELHLQFRSEALLLGPSN